MRREKAYSCLFVTIGASIYIGRGATFIHEAFEVKREAAENLELIFHKETDEYILKENLNILILQPCLQGIALTLAPAMTTLP